MSDAEPSSVPSTAADQLSVVLLPLEGAADAAHIVRDWLAVLDGLERDYELLVAEDCSSIIDAHVRRIRPDGPGAGAALRAGLAAAHHPLVCCAPCDRCYPPDWLKRFLERIERVQMVAGSRTGSKVPGPLRLLGWLYRWTLRIAFGVPQDPLPGWLGGRQRCTQMLFRVLFGLRLHDPACPMWLALREVASRFPLQSEGPFVHVELLAKVNFAGCVLDEAPLPWPSASIPELLRPMLPDLRRLFRRPDFGPATANAVRRG
jgi:hypothetical protein